LKKKCPKKGSKTGLIGRFFPENSPIKRTDQEMARAKRHYVPGHIWPITYRCHKRKFLLKFAIEWRIEKIKSFLGFGAIGRKLIGADDTFEL